MEARPSERLHIQAFCLAWLTVTHGEEPIEQDSSLHGESRRGRPHCSTLEKTPGL
jgi:hypothetical protein